jgi:hypothetical protein
MSTIEAELAHAKAVKSAHEAELLGLPRVVAVGVGMTKPNGTDKTRRPAIIVSVSELLPDRADIPSELDGVPVLVNATGVMRAQ